MGKGERREPDDTYFYRLRRATKTPTTTSTPTPTSAATILRNNFDIQQQHRTTTNRNLPIYIIINIRAKTTPSPTLLRGFFGLADVSASRAKLSIGQLTALDVLGVLLLSQSKRCRKWKFVHRSVPATVASLIIKIINQQQQQLHTNKQLTKKRLTTIHN